MSNDFDAMTAKFTALAIQAAGWKHNYYGAAYATRIRQAVADMKRAIEIAETHPEIGFVDHE